MTFLIRRVLSSCSFSSVFCSDLAKPGLQPVLRCAIALFVFSLAVNLANFNWSEAPIIYPDSSGYLNPANKILNAQLPNFSLRSPTYPMYLFFAGLFGQMSRYSLVELAAYGQIVLGAITIVLLFLICLKLLERKGLALGISALLALNFEVSNYQAAILTETLSGTLIMAVLYAHIASLNQRPTWRRLFGLVALDSLLVMLRPNFVFLPAGLYALQFVYLLPNFRSTPAILVLTNPSVSFLLLGMLSNVGLVATWIALFYLQTGSFGLSRTSDINLVGKAIQYEFLDRDIVDSPHLARRTQEIYFEEDRPKDPYVVINRLRKENLGTLENLRQINLFFLGGHGVTFAIETARLLPEVLNKRPGFYYGSPNGPSNRPLLRSITRVFNSLHVLNGKSLIFAIGYAIYLFIKNRREQFMTLTMILSSIVYHIISISAFGYDEYARLRVPIDLLLNLLVVLPVVLLVIYTARRLKLPPSLTCTFRAI